jgi:hypothetical protein
MVSEDKTVGQRHEDDGAGSSLYLTDRVHAESFFYRKKEERG